MKRKCLYSQYPESEFESFIVVIHKKGDINNPDNYKGILLKYVLRIYIYDMSSERKLFSLQSAKSCICLLSYKMGSCDLILKTLEFVFH